MVFAGHDDGGGGGGGDPADDSDSDLGGFEESPHESRQARAAMATAATTALAEWAAAEQVRTHTPRRHSFDATATGLKLDSPATARMLLARMLPRWPTLAEMPGRPSEGQAHPEHSARITSASQTHTSDFRSISEMSDEIVTLRTQLSTMRAAVQQVRSPFYPRPPGGGARHVCPGGAAPACVPVLGMP